MFFVVQRFRGSLHRTCSQNALVPVNDCFFSEHPSMTQPPEFLNKDFSVFSLAYVPNSNSYYGGHCQTKTEIPPANPPEAPKPRKNQRRSKSTSKASFLEIQKVGRKIVQKQVENRFCAEKRAFRPTFRIARKPVGLHFDRL